MIEPITDDRLAEIRADLHATVAIDSSLFMTSTEDILSLLARLDKAEEALRPFAKMAEAYFHRYETTPGVFREAHGEDRDDKPVYGINGAQMTTGDLRAARKHLDSSRGQLADATPNPHVP